MLIVAGSITFDPSHTESLRGAAAAMMAATLEEPGCQEYVFSISVADEASIRIFEVWDSQEDLDAHFAMAHMAEFQAAIADVGISGTDLMKYQVSSSAPM